MYSKEEAHSQITALVERFQEQLPSYKKSDYNETLTRRDFIDPFFKALGWDMNNSAGNAEAYREVIHEDKIKIGSATKAPDYSFRLPGGKRLFFVEAKKPSVVVKDEILPAYQVRRYAWSAKLPISILTDFEEFAVYDCKKKPNISDKASTSRIKYITYKDYLPQFDFIWDNFSKEKVLKGGFDKYVQSDSNKKGTSTVDKEFLVSLDEWRKQLAQNIALRNIHLNEDEINYTVQQTIDRLIFLRIAEDRGVEEYGRLKTFLHGDAYYQNLFQYFKEADSKYNSGLFNFKKDTLSAGLALDNKVIKNILNELYYPISPYEFSVLSVEILGSAYEQFLGKQIRLTAGHKAVIEEKPEVRKAGGVYYTPQYIVEYIVKNTVGKLAEGKTPQEIEILKIVDPACGSGSFLIGAYEYLLNYHQQYYQPKFEELTKIAASSEYNSKQRSAAQKERNKLPLTPDGNLTTAVKKQILLNNIFGVDIDTQAVEVTKLSLMLKCMEGETKSSINAEMNFGERVLPTLEDNIKCGNSLIDVDFYDGQPDFEPGIEKKVKPFSWEKAFPKVFKQGGFDCVIGNPPYLRMQGLQETQPFSINYFKTKFAAAKTGNFDLYVLFDEKAYRLLNEKGRMGFIQPHKFFQADFGEGLRNFISKEMALSEVVNFGSQQVFSDATTYTCLLFLSKEKNKNLKVTIVDDLNEFATDNGHSEMFLTEQPKENTKWNFVSELKQSLFNKLSQQPQTLGDITRKIFVGLQTSADKIYVLETIKEKSQSIIGYSKSLGQEIEIEKGLVKPFLMGKDVKRYEPLLPRNFVIFPYKIVDGSAQIMSNDFIKNNFPSGWDYLLKNKKELEAREHNKMKIQNFYAYIYPKNLAEFEVEKICTPDISNKPNFALDQCQNLYHTTTVYSFVFNEGIKEDQKYFLALFNSDLLWYFLSSTGNVLRGGFFRFKTEYLKPFPIKLIDFKNKSEVRKYDEIVHLVETMLQLQKEKQQTALPHKLDQLNTRIEYTDEKINKLVFELYGLGEEERRVVEGG